MRRFPFPIPNGWFNVSYSDELEPGELRALRYFDTDLVLFRTEDGQARVLDAYCPHLGAHLGHGGRVVDGTVRCPFHAWRFDGDGQCVEVPYAKKIPPKARLRSWPVSERNGVIYVWRHAEGKPPEYELPELPEATSTDWSSPDRYRWRVKTANQEMGENSVDRAHFRYVHGTLAVPESTVTVDGHLRRSVQVVPMQTPRGAVEGRIDSVNCGLGVSWIRFTGICETLLLASVTAIDEETCDIRFSFTQQKVDGRDPEGGVGSAIIADIVKQMSEDIPIWENKIYADPPVLCDGDGPIGEWRRWCRQFYSEEASPAGDPSDR